MEPIRDLEKLNLAWWFGFRLMPILANSSADGHLKKKVKSDPKIITSPFLAVLNESKSPIHSHWSRFCMSAIQKFSLPYLCGTFNSTRWFILKLKLTRLYFFRRSDADLERLYEQWEEDDEPLPVDELPEWDPRKPQPQVSISTTIFCGLRTWKLDGFANNLVKHSSFLESSLLLTIESRSTWRTWTSSEIRKSFWKSPRKENLWWSLSG